MSVESAPDSWGSTFRVDPSPPSWPSARQALFWPGDAGIATLTTLTLAMGLIASISAPVVTIRLKPGKGPYSELVIAQGFHRIDVSDDREVGVKLGRDLVGDLVGQFAGAGEHLDFHIGEGV
jgi:hypothetical protein